MSPRAITPFPKLLKKNLQGTLQRRLRARPQGARTATTNLQAPKVTATRLPRCPSPPPPPSLLPPLDHQRRRRTKRSRIVNFSASNVASIWRGSCCAALKRTSTSRTICIISARSARLRFRRAAQGPRRSRRRGRMRWRIRRRWRSVTCARIFRDMEVLCRRRGRRFSLRLRYVRLGCFLWIRFNGIVFPDDLHHLPR